MPKAVPPWAAAINALLPPALCQGLLALEAPRAQPPEVLAQLQAAQQGLVASAEWLRRASQDPALATQAGHLVRLHAGLVAAAQIVARHCDASQA